MAKIQIDLKKVEGLAARGLSRENIAKALGISEDTLSRRRKENHGIDEAIAKGRALGEATIADALFEKAKKGNTVAMIFFLKARCGWKETDKQEIEVNQPVQIVVKNDLKD